jgi:sigma-B regulation protein RsbU (phosphoserine phosphatase)
VTNPKELFRKLEKTLGKIERSEDLVSTLSVILERLVDDFKDDLGVAGGRIYERNGDAYTLQREYPPRADTPRDFEIPSSYPPIQEILSRGYVLHGVQDPGIDREIERAIGVSQFAAIAVGPRAHQIIAFTLTPGFDPEEVVYTLNTIRHALNIKMRTEELLDSVAAVREIQMSLLPATPPSFDGLDIWALSVPAEEVGGDLYDFIPLGKRNLGIAVADASGHGLPAALQARDAIIGLRMGVQETLRITATLEKLNKVVNHSALASKFISLFYGELELNGTLVYCNAGHPPPLLWSGGSMQTLSRGGAVLGPNPDALYERGYVILEPGAILVAYTDGVPEAENAAGEQFGVERLKDLIRGKEWASAKDLVGGILQAVRDWCGAPYQSDDRTVVAILRPRGDGATGVSGREGAGRAPRPR